MTTSRDPRVALGGEVWQLAHATRACRPSSGYAVRACCETVNVDGVKPDTVWHDAQSTDAPPNVACPRCGSRWHVAQVAKLGWSIFVGYPVWHDAQDTDA